MFRRNFLKIIATSTLLPITSSFAKVKKYVYDMRFWSAPVHTRVVLDVSKSTKYTIIQLTNPNRVVVDLENGILSKKSITKLNHKSKRIKKIRHGKHKNSIRLVFDNSNNFKIKSFTLPPNSRYKNYRLVIDIKDKDKITNNIRTKKPVIVIDAGHGGEDPGAIGIKDSYEKNIVLDIAKKLVNRINKGGRFKGLLTRKADYYVSLKNRIKMAQRKNASLFISLHADAAIRKSARGISIYTLSKKGSNTSFTRHLEKTQNASDIFGAEPEIIDKDIFLNNFLTDLSRENRQKESNIFALKVLNEMKKVVKLHKKEPHKANFVVLKAPAIPSVLIETGFISNKLDEKNLNNKQYQDKISLAIFRGINKYFS